MSNNQDKMIDEILDAQIELQRAKARSSGITVAKERMKNLLYSYCNDLIRIACENKSIMEENTSLQTALDESDEENKTLRDEIKKLREQNTKSASKKADTGK